ncbi:MAG TPA: PASTA domain-containing protein [Gaiellaceae bacterium]|nr:PASTA domain-containing protein [Gaiellaceae bacterium]
MDLNRIPSGVAQRAAAVVALAVVFTAGVAWAASSGVPKVATVPRVTRPAPPKPLVVPDVRAEAFVFAKGALEEAGFAWHVVGKVHGYAANTVTAQSPAPGTKVYDTGAPLVTLTLEQNSAYAQRGLAEDASPYAATDVVKDEPATTTTEATAPVTTVAAPAATESTTTASTTTAAAPATTGATTAAPATTAATTTAATATAAAPRRAPAHAGWPATRPPAFVVAGAKREPLDEMPLPDRAQLLGRWLDAHRQRTAANVNYWLYQNAWVVDGAKFGWWHGADALRTLIAVDQRADALWGIGLQSANVARQALAFVEAKSKS